MRAELRVIIAADIVLNKHVQQQRISGYKYVHIIVCIYRRCMTLLIIVCICMNFDFAIKNINGHIF